jgi:riboflavin synthase
MFTGIVEAFGTLVGMVDEPPGKRMVVREPRLAADAVIGESIAINGCCLTVVGRSGKEGTLAFQAGPETLRCTNLGDLRAGSVVNLERSLKVSDRLGGHFVTGHIDGVGTLAARQDEGDRSTCWFSAPRELTAQMASKGSVAVDGVSLTLVDVEPERFSVALIPHTLAVTTLGSLRVGDRANLETDVLAKYVQRQLAARESTPAAPQQPGCSGT